jgi:hypothetical protein
MKPICQTLLIVALLIPISGCGVTKAERQAISKGTANISEMCDAVLKYKVPPEEILPNIKAVAQQLNQKFDSEKEFAPTKTSNEIYQGHIYAQQNNVPNPALEEIQKSTKKDIEEIGSGWNWRMILGGGIGLAALVGKFLGPPWNLAGMGLQLLGQRLVPDYDKTKKAAVGAIASVDETLTQFGFILAAMPEVNMALTEKLGKNPIEWIKEKLNKVQTDLGTPETSEFLDKLKKEMTTENGILKPTMADLDKFFKKLA